MNVYINNIINVHINIDINPNINTNTNINSTSNIKSNTSININTYICPSKHTNMSMPTPQNKPSHGDGGRNTYTPTWMRNPATQSPSHTPIHLPPTLAPSPPPTYPPLRPLSSLHHPPLTPSASHPPSFDFSCIYIPGIHFVSLVPVYF